MNRKHIIISIALGISVCLSGCGKKEEAVSSSTPSPTAASTATADTSTAPAGMYFSETTGLPISADLQNQRPIAAMVDSEQIALPSYGISDADIIYDMMNNVLNGRITRFMAVYKDYANVPQIGSIRSTRTTNVWLAGEWNAILCHDGQASYAVEYLANDYAQQHLSGIFSRVDNGKPTEFTEYIMPGEIAAGAEAAGIDLNYNQYKQEGDHFVFAKYNTEVNTSSFQDANTVQLPFEHNSTSLAYNSGTSTYDFSMYGEEDKDANNDQVLSFKNVLLLNCPFTEYPSGGYVYYNIVDSSGDGYYLTNGKMEPITWKKSGENGITHYYDANGNDLEMNRGKSYISLVPSDVWGELTIQ
jgi:hypothetical protein